MIRLKTIYFILMVMTTISSCGVISKTRYGNGIRMNISEPLFERKTTASIKSDQIPYRKKQSKNKPKEVERTTNFNEGVIYPFNLGLTNVAGTINFHSQKTDNVITKKTSPIFPIHPIDKKLDLTAHSKKLSAGNPLTESKIQENNLENAWIFFLKLILTILMFSSIAVLYVLAGIGLFFILIFTNNFVTDDDVHLFRSITNLAKISFKGIWSEWT